MIILPTATAYRRGLCTACQARKRAAGMPRCRPCHQMARCVPLRGRELFWELVYWAIGGFHAPGYTPQLRATAIVITALLWNTGIRNAVG